MMEYAVFVNRNDGKGWVRKYKKNYASAQEALAAAARCRNRTWILLMRSN